MIELKPVDRGNWEEALQLKVKKEQEHFVPSVAVSLAKVYIKPDGDDVEYLPFAIYAEGMMVGFIMHAFEEQNDNMYWINGFLIDEKHQGKGYGKRAMIEMISWIEERFPHSRETRLTVHQENQRAAVLYKRLDYLPTGDVYDGEIVYKRERIQ
ncbi:GNAT family N-acetyltransferase [Fictibacillus sp. KU28468]|uniref:GNAT family N-acetyltransferase n=1 Tax=Fictibacillus sp. KU28468 TaxID=2991053 RepID=UPI00223D8290|nr:GNAT family N-acetyltransferase [Fictibacillus sp. KU28468]UZJ77961.1 GNAT family N-acetyltransferase [Fictibacillus sp. KU28468]